MTGRKSTKNEDNKNGRIHENTNKKVDTKNNSSDKKNSNYYY